MDPAAAGRRFHHPPPTLRFSYREMGLMPEMRRRLVTGPARRSRVLVLQAALITALLACAPTAGTPEGVPPSSPAIADERPVSPAAPSPAARTPRTLQVAVQGLAGFFYPMWVADRQGM